MAAIEAVVTGEYHQRITGQTLFVQRVQQLAHALVHGSGGGKIAAQHGQAILVELLEIDLPGVTWEHRATIEGTVSVQLQVTPRVALQPGRVRSSVMHT